MKPTPNRLVLDNYPQVIEVPARFGDLDPNNHLNNVAIGQFYEEGRAHFTGRLFRKDSGVPRVRLLLANVSMSYLREGRYPALLRVGTGVLKLGRSSFTYGQALFLKDVCIGTAESIAVNSVDGGSAPLPEALRVALEAVLIKSDQIRALADA